MREPFEVNNPTIAKLMKEAGADSELLTLMNNRCRVGACRYNNTEEGYGFSFLSRDPETIRKLANKKLNKYQKTGNLEMVVDICNYVCFLFLLDYRYTRAKIVTFLTLWVDEFNKPRHPLSHWRCEDQGTSD